MIYDGSNGLHARAARARLDKLIRDGKAFELKERRPRRSLAANAYLHVCIAYFASQTGDEPEDVKARLFKLACNRDIFLREARDPATGQAARYLRSTRDLDSAEMAAAIERFRDWAAAEAGIYIPAPEERRLVLLMEAEAERAGNPA